MSASRLFVLMTALLSAAAPSWAADIHYQLFSALDSGTSSLADLDMDSTMPAATGTTANPGLAGFSGNYFALRFSGEIYSDGNPITLFLASDDGANLYIYDEIVLFNDGLHSAARTLSVTLNLSEGYHPIRVDYFDKWEGETLDITYLGTGMETPATLDAIVRPGGDTDGDSYADYYDKLYKPDIACDIGALSDPAITDFRDCDFSDMTFPFGREYSDKYFDRSIFKGANLNGTFFARSSFRGADFTDQYFAAGANGGHGDAGTALSWFANSDFSGALLENRWYNVWFDNVNFGGVRFQSTSNDPDASDPGMYCFEETSFSSTDMVSYVLPDAQDPGDIYPSDVRFLGLAGALPIAYDEMVYGSFCESKIEIRQQNARPDEDIAPVIFMRQVLAADKTAGANDPQVWTVAVESSNGNPDDESDMFPVYGDDSQPAFRTVNAATSPWWEWNLTGYHHIDTLRIYKNPEHAAELDGAILLVSDRPIGEGKLEPVNFDSISRYSLTGNPREYYELPLNRSAHYIRIQHPDTGVSKRLSFKALAMYGDVAPLESATTPVPQNFELPLREPDRPECTIGFDADLLDPDFDINAVQDNEFGQSLWDYADLSMRVLNGFDFSLDYFQNVNLQQSTLVGANFKGINGGNINFRGANLENANFEGANLAGSDFRGANLKGANFADTDAGCAYFSEAVPDSYSPINEFIQPPMVSRMSANTAYGYARASSLDLGTFPALAIDGDSATQSATAVQQNAWWELDMGAVYVLEKVSLASQMSSLQKEQIRLYVSDWPIPYDLVENALPDYVNRVTAFSVVDGEVVFHTDKTARYMRVLLPAAAGAMRLRLSEVIAQTTGIPSAPSTATNLSGPELGAMMPETQSLLEAMNLLSNLYVSSNPDDGLTSVAESVGKVLTEIDATLESSERAITLQKNARTILRPISSLDFILKAIAVIPSAKPTADKLRAAVTPPKTAAKVVETAAHAIQLAMSLENRKLITNTLALAHTVDHARSQVDLLQRGRAYIENLQRCAIYGSDAVTVRSALEAYAGTQVSEINALIDQLGDGVIDIPAGERVQRIRVLRDIYDDQVMQDAVTVSEDVKDAMGPLAAAITPMQILMADDNEIYDGLTFGDIVNFISKWGSVILDAPPIKQALELVDFLLDPLLSPLDSAVTGIVAQATTAGGGQWEGLHNALAGYLLRLDNVIDPLGEDVDYRTLFPVPSVDTNIFHAVANLSGGSPFASCRGSLNLPPQWPEQDDDNDGDGLTNGFEVGYAPGGIVAVTNTLADSADSDTDGLTDYFEWYWSTQTDDPGRKFNPRDGSLDEADRDDDSDGLSAVMEMTYGTNPYLADTDGDGISDRNEVEWALNPLSADGDLSDRGQDLNDDGVLVYQEMQYGWNPAGTASAFEDDDGDGLGNLDELLLGSSPVLAAPVLLQDIVITMTEAAQLAQAQVIELGPYIDYTQPDDLSLDEDAVTTSEGSVSVASASLEVSIQVDAGNAAARSVYVTLQAHSPGGSVLIPILVDIAIDGGDGGEIDPPLFAAGDGSAGDPYQIATAEQFNEVGNFLDAHFALTADLDFAFETGNADGAFWNGGLGWEPIGTIANPFTGHVDGNGFTISGLVIDRPDENEVGLFGETGAGAEIENLRLEGIEVTGNNNVGALVGFNSGILTGNYAIGTVNGNATVGALVGWHGGTVTASYATGSVDGDNRVGGLVGFGEGLVERSYAAATVTGNTHVGGLVGFNEGVVTDAYWNTQVSGQTDGIGSGSVTGAIGLTSEAMRQRASFTGFDFTDTWDMVEGQSFPFLQDNAQEPPPGWVDNVAATLSPANLDFGNVMVGQTATARTLTIENTGTGALIIGSLALSGINAADFAIADDTCSSHTIAPAALCTFAVTLTPSATGVRSARVDVPSDAPISPDVVPLTGTGTMATPDPEETPAPEETPGPVDDFMIEGFLINGGIIGDAVITANGILDGGSVTGTLNSEGEVRNVLLFPGARIEGGRVSGTISGAVGNPAFVNANIGAGTVLRNVRIGPDATLHPEAILEPGVCFVSPGVIPPGLDLSGLLDTVSLAGNPEAAALNLERSIACDESGPTLLQTLRELPAFETATLIQAPESGVLEVMLPNARAKALSVDVSQANADDEPGVYFNEDGDVVLITADGRRITAFAVQQGEPAMRKDFSARQWTVVFDRHGGMTITPAGNPGIIFRTRPHILALPVPPDTPVGLNLFLLQTPPNVVGTSLVFDDGAGNLLEQQLTPVPINWTLLKQTLQDLPGAANVRMEASGIISFTLNGQVVRALADYVVRSGPVTLGESDRVLLEQTGDLNDDGIGDLLMIFPDGDRQNLYLVPAL